MSKKTKKSKRKLARGANLQRLVPTAFDKLKAFVDSGERDFWIVHGTNYLHSELPEGLWSPLQDIYAGQEPDVEGLIKEVKARYQKTEEEWDPRGIILCSWIFQNTKKLFELYQSSSKLIGHEEVLKPENEDLWEMFETLKDQVLATMAD